MIQSAQKAYASAGGVHTPFASTILGKAIDTQHGYADRWAASGDPRHPVRAAMYPRQAHHIGSVVGQQQAMLERGAKQWRRVLHPELSKSGPCAECIADSHNLHDIEEPFFDHPLGQCGAQGLQYSGASGDIEIPVPGKLSDSALAKIVRSYFGKATNIIRRIRNG